MKTRWTSHDIRSAYLAAGENDAATTDSLTFVPITQRNAQSAPAEIGAENAARETRNNSMDS